MFTGIIQCTAIIIAIKEMEGLRTITLGFTGEFCKNLAVGASVSVDGACLTAVQIYDDYKASFDIMMQSLDVTTLGNYQIGTAVNVERAMKEGAEIGGHCISGHIDFCGKIINIRMPKNNLVMCIEVPPPWIRYIFNKGYVAINGTSLTVSAVNRAENWFEIWFIPETRRATTFSQKLVNDRVNIEIERGTQVLVDTVRSTLEENIHKLLPALSKALVDHKIIDEIVTSHLTLPSKNI